MSKPFRAEHLELRHKTYFAILYIPKDVRYVFGKNKFYKSTGTSDLKTAQVIAGQFVLGWKNLISAARFNSEDRLINSAYSLRNQSQNRITGHLAKDLIDEEEARIRYEEKDDVSADFFSDIAKGKHEPLSKLIKDWVSNEKARGLKQKTIDQMYKDVEMLLAGFKLANQFEEKRISRWIKNIVDLKSLSASSINRILCSCRSFARFLEATEEMPKDGFKLFLVPEQYKVGKKNNSKSKNKSLPWLTFKQSDVVNLHIKAMLNNDQSLADLILIAAFTGARIEEICSLKCNEIDFPSHISIVDAKTEAGVRDIPIHSRIERKIEELIKKSTDGHLISGLTKNKYGDRSNAIGKRFGRLKTINGFDNRHVFHSIRKTFVTCLENALVPENLAADIVGHENSNFTYGTYSKGFILEKKRGAIENVGYIYDLMGPPLRPNP